MSLKINNLQLDIGMKIMSELSKIDRFDATWISVEKREGPTLKQLKSIATVKSVGASTRIEGSKMTDDEVSVLIENINISSFEERDNDRLKYYASLSQEELLINLKKMVLASYGIKDEAELKDMPRIINLNPRP